MFGTETGLGRMARTEEDQELIDTLTKIQTLGAHVEVCGGGNKRDAGSLIDYYLRGGIVEHDALQKARDTHSVLTAMIEAQKAEKARQAGQIEAVA